MVNKKQKEELIDIGKYDENDIDSLMDKLIELKQIKKEVLDKEESLKTKIKIYLKERAWKRYYNKKSQISITLVSQHKETVDIKQLKLLFKPSQYVQLIKISTYEKMLLTTKEDRKRMKQYVRKKESKEDSKGNS